MEDVLITGAEHRSFRDDDWYGEELGAVRFADCVFTDVDLTEVTSRGTTFEGCTFHSCKLNASTHHATAFVGCDFRRCSFFTATLDGCKVTGSVFADCVMRPLTVTGGAWVGVSLRGHDLSGLDLRGVDLREADLSMSDLTGAVLAEARLDGAAVRETEPEPGGPAPRLARPRRPGLGDLEGDADRPVGRRHAGRAPRRRRRSGRVSLTPPRPAPGRMSAGSAPARPGSAPRARRPARKHSWRGRSARSPGPGPHTR